MDEWTRKSACHRLGAWAPVGAYRFGTGPDSCLLRLERPLPVQVGPGLNRTRSEDEPQCYSHAVQPHPEVSIQARQKSSSRCFCNACSWATRARMAQTGVRRLSDDGSLSAMCSRPAVLLSPLSDRDAVAARSSDRARSVDARPGGQARSKTPRPRASRCRQTRPALADNCLLSAAIS